MLDYSGQDEKRVTVQELVAGLTPADLRYETDQMIDAMLAQLEDCLDADVIFVPQDPAANDPYAVDEAEVKLSWTLGHVVVHITASSEESAALASELARGVALHGRSRYEVPWQSVTTIEQCRHRLEESRRMRHASLEMWPDEPHLENRYTPWQSIGEIDAAGRFVLGLKHDWSHLRQIKEIVRQAKTARGQFARI